jgi:hypothetical protein
MLFKEIISVYGEKHAKTNKYKMRHYWLSKQMVHIVTARPRGVKPEAKIQGEGRVDHSVIRYVSLKEPYVCPVTCKEVVTSFYMVNFLLILKEYTVHYRTPCRKRKKNNQ